MSWTDVFPALTEEMATDYNQLGTHDEKQELESWLGVKRRINVQPSAHLVSVSVFWKNVRSSEPDLPDLTRDLLMNATQHGLVQRYEPWQHYIQPILDGAVALGKEQPQVTVRVYLAADLEFLVPDFTAVGCEIFLMKSNSLRHNPGAMWRFLAFSERNRLVTTVDSDRFAEVVTDVLRTESLPKTGHAFWRVPVITDFNDGRVQYRPIMGTQCGSAKSMPTIRTLMAALIWHTRRGSIRLTADGDGCAPQGIVGTEWPDYGFDEWFLLTTLYPRLAGRSVLSIVKTGAMSRFLPLDIEYVTWANPDSEMIFHGQAASCCGTAVPRAANKAQPAQASNGQVLLTGMWQVKTANDVALITELCGYAKKQDAEVAIKPVLHVQDQAAFDALPEWLRKTAVIWEGLKFNTQVQRGLVHAISSAHEADWVWEVDSDERVDFACVGGLKAAMAKAESEEADYVEGEWIDRIARLDHLPAIRKSKPLAEQFPVPVLAVKFVSQALPKKIALHRRECLSDIGNHLPMDRHKLASTLQIPIWHFKWHSDCQSNQIAKLEAEPNEFWSGQMAQSIGQMKAENGRVSIDWSKLPKEAFPKLKKWQKTGAYPCG